MAQNTGYLPKSCVLDETERIHWKENFKLNGELRKCSQISLENQYKILKYTASSKLFYLVTQKSHGKIFM